MESGVSRITVTPAATDSSATISWLDSNGSPLADADGSTEGFQVDLSTGEKVVNIKVTAEDTTTTQTYTLTIVRQSEQGTTPTVSIEAVHAKAAPRIAHTRVPRDALCVFRLPAHGQPLDNPGGELSLEHFAERHHSGGRDLGDGEAQKHLQRLDERGHHGEYRRGDGLRGGRRARRLGERGRWWRRTRSSSSAGRRTTTR